MMLFDWIYPAYTPILQRAVDIWYQDPQVLSRMGIRTGPVGPFLDKNARILSVFLAFF